MLASLGATIDIQTPVEYGVVPAYGMPVAEFLIKGTVRSAVSQQPLGGIALTLKDSEGSSMLAPDTTTNDGSFSFILSDYPLFATSWLLSATDIDGVDNGGSYFDTDTLLSIPLETISEGRGELTVEMVLQEKCLKVNQSTTLEQSRAPRMQLLPLGAHRAQLHFGIAQPSPVRIGLYDTAGRRVTQLLSASLDKGEHTLVVDYATLAQGSYYVRLDNGGFARVIKVVMGQ
jgi:putative lipoprotein (rSAM/lipoprotein system)